ncbi:alcohol dehydrogenase [Mycolicibacterium rhodesiae JS60]|nr:alcohol dehydrogenase [Mycolicibacterium rhodesiae JS60]
MGVRQDWNVEEVELDPPKDGEVLVSFEATGPCHSDVTPALPMTMFTLFQKRLLGSLYGQANPRADMLAGRNIRGVVLHEH